VRGELIRGVKSVVWQGEKRRGVEEGGIGRIERQRVRREYRECDGSGRK